MLSYLNHMSCSSGFSIPKSYQSFSLITHLDVTKKPSTFAPLLPLSRVQFNWNVIIFCPIPS